MTYTRMCRQNMFIFFDEICTNEEMLPKYTHILYIYIYKYMDLKYKQTLNNGFPNYMVDTEIKHFINKTEQYNIDNTLDHKQLIHLQYKIQFHSNYKIDEHILKKLTKKCCHCRYNQKSKTSFTTTNLKATIYFQ